MRIRMLAGIAGADWSALPGDEIEMSDGEAARLIAAGYALTAGLETATIGPAENAAVRTRPAEPRRGNRRTS